MTLDNAYRIYSKDEMLSEILYGFSDVITYCTGKLHFSRTKSFKPCGKMNIIHAFVRNALFFFFFFADDGTVCNEFTQCF